MSRSLLKRKTSLTGNLVLLCRFLRDKGYTVGFNEEQEILRVLDYWSLSNRYNLKIALKVILARGKTQFTNFDADFDEFWRQLSKALDSKLKDNAEPAREPIQRKTPTLDALKSWLYNEGGEDEVELARFSPVEHLTRKNFANMDEDEVRLINQLLRKLTPRLAQIQSRLRVRSKKAQHLDLRQTIRRSMRHGGALNRLYFTEKKRKKIKLVLLADVSKSMELYSRFFIHLIYAFHNSYDRISTWVFSTAIHDVSPLLNGYEFDKAFEMIAERVPQWSGGTRIGDCLNSFNRTRTSWALDKNTVVFIVSDGWDTGDPGAIEEAMSEIYRQARRVIWLNPLAGNPGFTPEVSGLKRAMPFIDLHAPCHNLESLKAALGYMKKTSRRAPGNNLGRYSEGALKK